MPVRRESLALRPSMLLIARRLGARPRRAPGLDAKLARTMRPTIVRRLFPLKPSTGVPT